MGHNSCKHNYNLESNNSDSFAQLRDGVRANIQAALTKNPDVELHVLITTGALNPVHRGHVRMMQLAASALPQKYPGKAVVGCAFSPSHDQYVQSKGLSYSIPATERCDMVEAALTQEEIESKQHHRILYLDSWECEQEGFTDFPAVKRSLENRLQNSLQDVLQGRRLKVLYVCGEDHVHKCRMYYKNWVLCITRAHNYNTTIPSDAELLVVEGDAEMQDVSSTQVRDALCQAGNAEELRVMLKGIQYESVTEMLLPYLLKGRGKAW